MTVSEHDVCVLQQQLGRTPRSVVAVSYRTPDGQPGVITTFPRLSHGEPFPTLYYLTEPRLVSAISFLESHGVMEEFTTWVQTEVQSEYKRAHEQYLIERNALEDLGTSFSGGGMPERVKCLHVLLAHSLAAGSGVNPVGDVCASYLADTMGMRGTVIPHDWPALHRKHEWLFRKCSESVL